MYPRGSGAAPLHRTAGGVVEEGVREVGELAGRLGVEQRTGAVDDLEASVRELLRELLRGSDARLVPDPATTSTGAVTARRDSVPSKPLRASSTASIRGRETPASTSLPSGTRRMASRCSAGPPSTGARAPHRGRAARRARDARRPGAARRSRRPRPDEVGPPDALELELVRDARRRGPEVEADGVLGLEALHPRGRHGAAAP